MNIIEIVYDKLMTKGHCDEIYNADIAKQFNKLADLLEIEGANPFRIRAYRNAGITFRT